MRLQPQTKNISAHSTDSSVSLQRRYQPATGAETASVEHPLTPVASQPTSFHQDFSQVSSHFDSGPIIQTKLTVGSPNDKYEQEADRVADQIMRMPAPSEQTPVTSSQQQPRIQRVCSSCEEELKHKPMIQTKQVTAGSPEVTPAITARIQSLQSGGQPLSASARNFFEPRFGQDFSRVRIHTDAQSTQALNAKAYTNRETMVFGAGQYAPETEPGRRLIAHELTHVVQQSSQSGYLLSANASIQRFVTCEGGETCPSREPGEIRRSRSEPMELFEITSGGIGMLISNFAVGASAIRGDLTTNPRWNSFVRAMATNPNVTWEILGFTDCQGNEALNATLRFARATALFLALPEDAMAQVESYGRAAMTECIKNNTMEENRRLNRSVMIRQKSVRYDFEPEIVPTSSPFVACFDGSTVYARKNGMRHRCSAVTGTAGAPTPDGVYCIRRQGEAQISGGLTGRIFQDRDEWYLLEPQFSTTRYRMHLHPGRNSEGCVTATDEGCFDQLANVLNSSGTTTAQGYDGYPPGNAAGVTNSQRSVTCVGLLFVTSSSGGCAFIQSPTP